DGDVGGPAAPVARVGPVAAVQVIRPRPPQQNVVAAPPGDRVVAPTAVEPFVGTRPVQPVVVWSPQDHLDVDQDVLPLPRRGPGAKVDVHRLGRRGERYGVATAPSAHLVVTGAGDQSIVPAPAGQDVVGRAADEAVGER